MLLNFRIIDEYGMLQYFSDNLQGFLLCYPITVWPQDVTVMKKREKYPIYYLYT